MTTNQTIDGVRRDLLERLLNAAEWQKLDFDRSDSPFKAEIAATVHELRALLDREVITDDHLRQRIAFLTSEVHARANERDAAISELAELKSAQPQGEPVAHMPVERCYDVRAKMIIAFNESKKAGGDLDDALDAAYKSALRYSPNPMNAEQPAPVAVVLPERDTLRDIIAQAIGGDAYDCTRVWSAWGVGTMSDDDFVPVVAQEERLYEIADACLDEVTRLNTK